MDAQLDEWGKRKHPNRYTPKELRAMLVDDGRNRRTLGGPAEKGCAFLIGACDRIAKADRIPVDDVFVSIVDEIQSLTGDVALPLA